MIEILHKDDTRLLLTTTEIDTPDYVPDIYGEDSSLMADGRRALGYVREVGKGAVAYFSLGHCHSPTTNVQVTVDRNIDADNVVPLDFRGVWDTDNFKTLIGNGVAWGVGAA